MPEPAGSAKSILVVDDDPAIRRLLEEMVAAPERRVDTAADGEEALARLEIHSYDLVITDIRMPGIDGIELLGRIRALNPRTRVIVITGAGTPAEVARSLHDNAYAYFSKPFPTGAMEDIVAQALAAPESAEDDIEVVSARPDWITLSVRCRACNADRLIQFFREMDVNLPPHERDQIAMAFRELLMNAIEHGCGSNPEQRMRLAFVRTSRALLFHIQDPGPGFSLDNLPHAAISNPPGDPYQHARARAESGLRPGGFGILLARNLVDELIYNEKGNEVLLVKYRT